MGFVHSVDGMIIGYRAEIDGLRAGLTGWLLAVWLKVWITVALYFELLN